MLPDNSPTQQPNRQLSDAAEPLSELDPGKLTVGELVSRMKAAQLWTLVLAITSIAGGSFALGYKIRGFAIDASAATSQQRPATNEGQHVDPEVVRQLIHMADVLHKVQAGQQTLRTMMRRYLKEPGDENTWDQLQSQVSKLQGRLDEWGVRLADLDKQFRVEKLLLYKTLSADLTSRKELYGDLLRFNKPPTQNDELDKLWDMLHQLDRLANRLNSATGQLALLVSTGTVSKTRMGRHPVFEPPELAK
jgi:hypothetical protein